jgi:DNA (cytosine-5)-methyltransferase 1
LIENFRLIEQGESVTLLADPAVNVVASPELVESRKTLQFIDLFAGIGGFRKAFEPSGADCVFTSEWDKFAELTYRANFADDTHQFEGDIRLVDERAVPDHDVLVGGFPCQPFSLAGVSKKNSLGRAHGFLDPIQGTLFFDIARIIAWKQPQAVLLENVRNLLSHDGKKTFAVIRQVLEEDLGYRVHFKVLDAKAYLPQHRERVVIVAFRDGQDWDWDSDMIQAAKPVTLDSILHREDGSELDQQPYIAPSGEVASKYTLSDKLWEYLQRYAQKHRDLGNGFGFGMVDRTSAYTRTLSARYHKDGSEILVSQPGMNPRRLTPRECARLMGFGDDFVIPVSDTQAYRQFGNSIAVPMMARVANQIVQTIAG